jgi:predicted TIM-barrel fold metal-dependent hydrolase
MIPAVPAEPPVFDAHVHVGPNDQLKEAARRALMGGRDDLDLVERVGRSAKELLKAMDAEGIARAALITSVSPEVMGLTASVNPWIAAYVEGHRDRLVPVGGIHPRHTDDVAGEMRRLFDDYRLGAIKIHPPHMELAANAYRTSCPALADVYRLAGEARRPVLIHTGTSVFPGARNVYADPMPCDDVAVDFPATTIVLCHAGRPLWYETALFLVRRHPNVWLDISGIPPKKLPDALPRLPDVADRVLWGTDWPSMGVRSMRWNVAEFLSLPLPGDVKRKILFDNAERLFSTDT